jgi:DNA repair protein RadC
MWLQRVELRSPRQTGEALEQSGFASRIGCLGALFVDEKCGLICAETIEPNQQTSGHSLAHVILRLASGYHASGLIMATNDLNNRVARSPNVRELTMKLYHMGNAINVPLLDHVVLTSCGWKSMFTTSEAERF